MQQFYQVVTTIGAHIRYIKFIIKTEPKTVRFDLPKDVDNNLKHEIDSIIKYNGSILLSIQ